MGLARRRAHLSSPEIGLDTHIMDIFNVLRYEKLEDVLPVMARMADRARSAGWDVREMPTWDHWPILDKPQEVAALLLDFA